MTTAPTPFDVTAPLPTGRLALEASAGTGKTWTIAALVTRWIAEDGRGIDQLLVVTFTRAATAELRDRIRTRLVEAHDHLDAWVRGGSPTTGDVVVANLTDVDDDQRRLRRDRLARALADFDAATITTIHGFCHQVLAASGFQGDVDGHGDLVEEVDDLVRATTRDLLVSQWAEVPQDQQVDRPSPALAASVGTAVLRDPLLRILPDPDEHDLEPREASLVALAKAVRVQVDQHKRRRGIVTFDDLLIRLRDSLVDPQAGAAIRASMRERYQVALIDEFQDTDPVQWSILSSLFEDRPLVLIGDPKQAIYRFRGADVHAYLDAISQPGVTRHTLATNHRTDQRLVDACNRLFEGVAFGDAKITHHDVNAHHRVDRLHFPDGKARAPLEVRVRAGRATADVVRPAIADDLACEVTRLLASGAQIDPAGEPGGRRRVRPGDCAVLVRTNQQAEDVKAALGEVGVHAVVNGVGSVLESPASQDWQRLLEALDRPSSRSRVRAVALTPVMGRTAAQVGDADEDADAELHECVHRWSRVLAEHGLATLVRTVQRETRMPARLLSVRGGDRWLADFEHVAELLHSTAAAEHLGASALLSWLVDQQRRTDELPADQRARRLESDALAVQVLTIHRAKGLQFPIVYCPYVMGHGSSPSVPLLHQDPDLGCNVVHLGGPGEGRAKELSRADDLGEHLRLLYVALTRAEHRAVIWWWPVHRQEHSPFSKLLFGTGETPRVRASEPAPVVARAGRDAKPFDAAIARLGPDATWTLVPDPPTAVAWEDTDVNPPVLDARTFVDRIDRRWQRSSFSAMTRPVPGRQTGGVVAGTDEAVATTDEHDEAETHDVVTAGDATDDVVLPLGAQPAGAAFGTMVHHLLEHVDFRADDLSGAIGAVRRDHRHDVRLDDPAGLDDGLALAVRTPLGPAFGGLSLSDLDRRDRLDELDFELPLAQGDGEVTLAAIADLLRQHLPSDDPFASYADDLMDRALARRVHGWLTGSIDLVLRRPDPAGGHRFHVVDHKSNRLYDHDVVGTTAHYDGASMVAAMRHGHYVLQSLLYQVALHRYLRWRSPGHDPEADLGAVGYLFVRGMVGPDAPPAGEGVPAGTPAGVLAWQPPTSLILALSDLLDRGGRP